MHGGACEMKSVRFLIQLSRPIFILLAVLLYFLGISIAHYLSGPINWSAFSFGLAWIVLISLGSQYLNEYFDPFALLDDPPAKHTPFSGGSGAIGTSRLPRQAVFWMGLACYTLAAAVTYLIFQDLGMNSAVIIILGVFLVGEILYALPPFRMVSTGYGEVIMSILIVGLIPALAYLMQGHDFHRLLIMIAFPLTTMHIGMLLAMEFPDYASDITQGKRPALVRIGWQRAMLLHNILILGSFVMLGLAFVFGLPIHVAWPVIFVLPIGLYQIWMMNRIGEGARPNWSLLELVAISTFGLTAYILTFAFWTH
jgi:1,4-dihydroxy-2-naphthoate octaprenyltransferase